MIGLELTADELALALFPEHAIRALGTEMVHDAVIAKRTPVPYYGLNVNGMQSVKSGRLYIPLLMAGHGHFLALTRNSATWSRVKG